MRTIATLACAATALAVAGCGGEEEPESDTRQDRADCQMTAAKALDVHGLLERGGRRSSSGKLVLRSVPGRTPNEDLSVVGESPDPGRHVFVLANRERSGTLDAIARSGMRSARLTAAPGCGAIASLPDEGPYRVRFTIDGKPDAGLSESGS
jgi:hypothetical protein